MELRYLKKYIYDRLIALTDVQVYDFNVPDDAVFPYVCFKFTSTDFNVRTRADRILEIDFWNNSNDDSKLLELLDRVKNGNGLVKGLNYSIQDELEGFYKAYIEFEGEIQTNETEIIRHNQRYIVKCD